jgi:hypothetical protein
MSVGARDWTKNQDSFMPTERFATQTQCHRNVRWSHRFVYVCRTVRRSDFMKSFQLSRGFTWSSAVPPMIPSAADEQRLCPTQRALSSTFSNSGYERIGFVTTLYRVHKLLSGWLTSVRFSEETNQQRPGVEGPTDSSIGQHRALLWRADMPQGACPQ